MSMNGFMSGVAYKEGVLTGTTLDVPLAGAPMPCTLTLTGVGAVISVATDGGVDFFAPDVDGSSGNMITVSLLTQTTHARFAAPAGSKWSIR